MTTRRRSRGTSAERTSTGSGPKIDEGFCVIEVLFDEGGQAVDYRFVDMNRAFVAQTGLVEAQGRTITTISISACIDLTGRCAGSIPPRR